MGLMSLFLVALMPVLKIILITGLGWFLALDRIKILGPEANHHLNNVVFYVVYPALAASCLAETITFESLIALWFMPVNLFLTFLVGSALAWILIKITKTPKHLKGIVIGCCSAGNIGNLTLIMLPSMCDESSSTFGDPSICSVSAKPLIAIAMSIGSIYFWTYTYGIMQYYATKSIENGSIKDNSETVAPGCLEGAVAAPPTDSQTSEHHSGQDQNPPTGSSEKNTKVSVLKLMLRIKTIRQKIDLRKVFAPTTIAAVIGLIIGIVPPIRKLMIGSNAPLRVIDSTAYILGEATIPCMTLVMGANLLKGLKGSDVSKTVIIGIIIVRNIFLPISGIGIVKAARHYGMIGSDSLYQFSLMLQYAVPPATALGTITEFFKLGQGETSVIMLWTHVVAALTLTLWSTIFMWLLA